MSDMNVSMRLTLSDLASGPLKEFMGQLDGLSAKITALNTKFTSFSTTSREFNASNQASASSITGLNARVDALIAGLSTMTAKLTSSVAAMESLAPASNAAAVGLQNTTRSLDGVAGSAGRARDSIRGLVEAYGALKIAQGLGSSIRAGSDYQATQTRLSNLNVPGANVAINQAANQAARAVPQMSREQTLSMGIDLVNATGSVEHAVSMLKPFAQAMFNMKMAMPTGKRLTESDMLSVAKALEQRGVTMDPAKMQTELDYFSKIIAATQGRVGPQQLLGNINYSKGGLGLTMEDKFLPIFASLIERQGTGNGGHGGQVGTALTSLQQAIVGGVIKQSALIDWSKMGLLDPNKLVFTSTGALKGVQAGGVAGSSLFMKNPYEWVQQYLVPALKKAGVNTADATAVNEHLAHLFGNRNAANIASIMATQQPLLNKDAAIINESRNNQQQYDANVKTAKASFIQFHAALDNLSIAIGTSVIPQVTKLTNAISSLIEKVSEFLRVHPAVTGALTELAAAFGAVMAIKAAAWFLRLIGVMESLGGATGVLAATWSARLAAMGAVALRFAGVVGIAFGLYEGLRHLQVAGVSMQNTVESLVDALISQFASFFLFLSSGFDKISNAIHNTVADAVNGAQHAAQFLGIGGYVHPGAPQQWMAKSNSSSSMTKWIKSFRDNRDNAGVDALMPHGGKSHVISMPEGELGAGAAVGSAFNPFPPIPAHMSGSHLGRSRVNAIQSEQARKYQSALDFLRNSQAKNDPIQQIKNRFAPNIMALSSGGRVDLAAQLEGLQNQQIGKEHIVLAQKHLKDLQSELADKQTQNAALVTAGVLTPDQAQSKTIADQKAAAPGLLKAAEAVRQYQLAMGESTSKIDTAIITFQALGDELTQLQQKISNAIQGAFSTFFDQLMGGKTSWKDMGKKFVENIMNGINSAASKDLSSQLVSAIFGKDTIAGQGLRSVGGSGGLMTALGNTIGGGKSGAGIGSFFSNLIGGGGSGGSGGASQKAMLDAQWAGSPSQKAMLDAQWAGSPSQKAMLDAQWAGSPSQQAMLDAQWAGSASASTGSSSSGWMSALGSIVGSVISSFAVGADNIPHDMVAQIHKGEMIIPAAGAEAIRQGKLGGGGHTVNMNIHAMDSQSVLGAMDGIKRELAGMLNSTNSNLNLGY